MTSELRVDNLKGSTTGGSINVLGEGTSATTNLQQGLCKAWVNFTMKTSTTIRDSFNVSGTTDNGTGDYSYDFANNMSNSNYCAMGTCISTVPRIASVYGTTTSQFEIRYHNESGSDTNTENSNMVHGDLA